MPIRPLLLAPAFAAAAFACLPMPYDAPNLAARANCVLPPAPIPVAFTIVRGDVDAYVVGEFEHPVPAACDEIVVDSVTRGVPPLLPRPKPWDDNAVLSDAGAVTVHWRAVQPERDSAGAATCAKIRRSRVVSAIPRSYSPLMVYPPIVQPADSVFECHDGYCSRMPRRVVDNKPDPGTCLAGMPAPAPSREAALEYIRGRLEASGAIFQLTRAEGLLERIPPKIVVCRGDEPILPADTLLQEAAPLGMDLPAPKLVLPPELLETRIVLDDGLYLQWPRLGAWNDTAVSADLAIPSPGNAGDRFESESIQFFVNPLRRDNASIVRSFFVRTGIKRYEYIGRRIPSRVYCGPAPASEPTIVDDTLRLDGASIRLTNEGCPRKGIDVFAGEHPAWLVVPAIDQTLAEAMRHGASIENGTSWPIDGDSVLVRGWNLPLEDVLAIATAVEPANNRGSGFSVRLAGASLEIAATRAGAVEVLSASGRILVRRDVVAGRNAIQLPAGGRGMLLVRSSEGTAKVLVH